jgi:hypothetical protein
VCDPVYVRFLRAVTIAASSADRLFLRQSIGKGRVAATKLRLNDHDHHRVEVNKMLPNTVLRLSLYEDGLGKRAALRA